MNYVNIFGFDGSEQMDVSSPPETRYMGVLVATSHAKPDFLLSKRVAFTVKPYTAKPIQEKKKQVQVRVGELYCRICGTTEAPEWRTGPEGPKTLCNACGIKRYRRFKAEKTKEIVPGQIPLERLIHKNDLESAASVKSVKDGVSWTTTPPKTCPKKKVAVEMSKTRQASG